MIDLIQSLNSMLISTFFFILLPIYVIGDCIQICATCVNPNTFPQKTMCLSCNANYILIGRTCFDCNNCNYFDICDYCAQQNTSSASNSNFNSVPFYAIKFGTLAGIICVFIIFIYYKFCKRSHQLHPEAHNRNSHAQTSQLSQPLHAKWVKSQNMIKIAQNCAICLDNNVALQTKCKHLYHAKCIWQWCTKKQISCPLCKRSGLEPIHLYCGKCYCNYIEIKIGAIPKALESVQWNICESCKQENQ